MIPNDALIERLRTVLGPAQVLSDHAEMAPYLTDWRGRYHGAARCVVRPGTTAEVAAAVHTCTQAGVAVVAQGGNTGLCGGATPNASGTEVVIQLSRMNRMLGIDSANNTISVEAGCTLAAVQEYAASAGRLFPLSLASEGSCQIGGNLSTNAGGVHVLRYGNMRDLTLGLEVVLADGQVWNGLRGLRKDNTGYDLKHLFIGAEGTLGIITAATLKLFPLLRSHALAWVALADPAAALALAERLRNGAGERLHALELIGRPALDLVLQHIPHTRDPFPARHAWYLLVELADSNPAAPLDAELSSLLEGAFAAAEIQDAALAQDSAQRSALWKLRESISEAQRIEGFSIKHDIAVPVSAIAEFIQTADAAIAQSFPQARVVAFGHLGDGNLHYNLSAASASENDAMLARAVEIMRLVHDLVVHLGGSLSAEHGIGQLKRHELVHYKSPLELELMLRVKRALDPQALMNPGKVLL
ncbi:MAG: FAD-binding oxidoreductase [Rhodocyclaceae bacterium]|nr:FAD-binding oxidoreductase [Rhodocyclaceae bacterium]